LRALRASMIAFMLTLAALSLAADEKLPPWQSLLKGEDAKKAAELQKEIDQHWEAAKFEEARKAAEALAELRNRAQGADHWEAVNANCQVKAIRSIMTKGADLQKEIAGTPAVQRQAETHVAKERYRDAQPLLETILMIHRKVLGDEDHR